MINAIELRKFRNAEFIQFNRNLITIIEKKNPKTLMIKPQFDIFSQKQTELEELFKSPTANPITAEMEELDLRRDEAITGISGLINSYSHHFIPEIKQAAIMIQNNLKLYNSGIARENYQSETAIISNLINDWRTKSELMDAVGVLSLYDWIEELNTANTLFDEKYLARNESYATEPSDNLKSKREEMMILFYNLRKCMEVFSITNKSAAYENAINEVNQLINKYNALLQSRKTKPVEPTNN